MNREPPTGSGRLGPVARRLDATSRVLVIEDEADIAVFLRAYFRAAGYDFVHVDPDSADEAMAALAEHDPDCVLLDRRLRGFRGDEVHDRMRQDPRFARTPVVVVSAEASPDRRPVGLDAYVTKPFNTDILADLVSHQIQLAEALGDPSTAIGPMSEAHLRARLVHEFTASEPGDTFSLALVCLRPMSEVVEALGDDDADRFVQSLAADLVDAMPEGAVVGLTGPGEMAVVLASTTADDAARLLRETLAGLEGRRRVDDDIEVDVRFSAGVAAYPDHAGDPDELYMAADGALAEAQSSDPSVVVAL